MTSAQPARIFEFLLLFAGGPVLVLGLRQPGVLFLLLWLGGFWCYRASRSPRAPAALDIGRILRRLSLVAPLLPGLVLRALAGERSAAERAANRAFNLVILRFLVCGAALAVLTWFVLPTQFLSLPRQHPVFWVAIIILYPLLSVWPQEVIYRRFLFYRYGAVFGERGTIAVSAAAFSFAHIIFLNWVALLLTLGGGAMFAGNYAKNRSLWLVCLEHGLYGCLVFTIGLGRYFFTGAAWHR